MNIPEARAAIERAIDKLDRNQWPLVDALRSSQDPRRMQSAAVSLFEGLRRNLLRALKELQDV